MKQINLFQMRALAWFIAISIFILFILIVYKPSTENVYIRQVILLDSTPTKNPDSNGTKPANNSIVPEFIIYDEQQEVFTNDNLKEVKLNIFHFWATWCIPCIKELKSLHELYTAFQGSKHIRFMAIAVDKNIEDIKNFISNLDTSFDIPIYHDAEGKTATAFGTYKFPETYFISSRGVIIKHFVGAQNWQNPNISELINNIVGNSSKEEE